MLQDPPTNTHLRHLFSKPPPPHPPALPTCKYALLSLLMLAIYVYCNSFWPTFVLGS